MFFSLLGLPIPIITSRIPKRKKNGYYLQSLVAFQYSIAAKVISKAHIGHIRYIKRNRKHNRKWKLPIIPIIQLN